MPQILIITCPKCTRLLLAKTDQKTRTCPYCGTQIATDRAKKIATAKDAREANTLLQKLKTQTATKHNQH